MSESAKKISDKEKKIQNVLAAFFSRCGVPYSDVTYGSFFEEDATVTFSTLWSFRIEIKDKPIVNIASTDEFMTASAMSIFTDSASRELRASKAEKEEFINRLKTLSIKDLHYLTQKKNVINEKSAVGKVRKNNVPTKNKVCPDCGGKGITVCAVCGGTDPNCKVCGGKGKSKCGTCGGHGKITEKNILSDLPDNAPIERSILYIAEGTDEFSLSVPKHDGVPELELTEEERSSVFNDAKFEQSSAEYVSENQYKITFTGTIKLYRQTIVVKDSHVDENGNSDGTEDVIVYNAVGEKMRPVNRPPILDTIFANEAAIINFSVRSDHRHDQEQKIACCGIIASKAILTKTLRVAGPAYSKEIVETAKKYSMSVEDLMDDELVRGDPQLRIAREECRRHQIDDVTQALKDEASNFVSDDFARTLARDLVDFLPILDRINPKSKTIWGYGSIVTWSIVFVALIIFPSITTLPACFLFSVLVAIFISYKATQNMPFFRAASQLKIRSTKGRKIPDMGPEAINSARLVIVTVMIEVMLYYVWF